MEILNLKASTKEYLWGGNRLRNEYNIESAGENIAEAWVLSSRADGETIILNGEFAGKTFREYLEKNGNNVIGTLNNRHAFQFNNKSTADKFPVLIKLIDADKDLSIQVHPDDDFASAFVGESGKSEMWYILAAKPGAKLVYGLNKSISRDTFEYAAKNGTITEYLNYTAVKPGDVYYIPAGTVHAIGSGILLAEIQQNSNTTYRLYDYDRLDKSGKKRRLDVDKAVAVAKLNVSKKTESPLVFDSDEKKIEILIQCDYFGVYRLTTKLTDNFLTTEHTFHHLLILKDGGKIKGSHSEEFNLKKGMSLYIPAGYGSYTIEGESEFLLTKMEYLNENYGGIL